MKNFEKFEKEIREIGLKDFGLVHGCPIRCSDIAACSDCDFEGYDGCEKTSLDWLYAEYESPVGIDWTKVPIDARIIITMPNGSKMRRHFAGLSEDGKPCYYAFGIDSWVNDEAERVVILDDCTVEIVEE